MKTKKKQKALIGWREWVGFPELGIDRIKAKIDTGARTSVIHAFRVRKLDDADEPRVEFYLHPVQRRRKPEFRCTAPIVDERTIKSSNGESETRYVIITPIRLGEDIWPIELTLSNRDQMGFRVLAGRASIRGRCIVDPDSSFLLCR
ncbi:MAG: ATP-dependent zinc protease [Rhodospirillaceae bacterium]|nr:ATP-dependent zinc protease [Rhodospirillaceae bacterium]MBL6931385.1 ATP-dependent zinc protease [Rhodospirillales bacterium]